MPLALVSFMAIGYNSHRKATPTPSHSHPPSEFTRVKWRLFLQRKDLAAEDSGKWYFQFPNFNTRSHPKGWGQWPL